jgi:hypothetical protein
VQVLQVQIEPEAAPHSTESYVDQALPSPCRGSKPDSPQIGGVLEAAKTASIPRKKSRQRNLGEYRCSTIRRAEKTCCHCIAL